jgi:hypothetical protein
MKGSDEVVEVVEQMSAEEIAEIDEDGYHVRSLPQRWRGIGRDA